MKNEQTSSSNELVANIDPKEIQAASSPEQDKEKLDEHGRLKHEDTIVFKCKHEDLIFMHESIREILNKGLVPEPELGPVFSLLEMLAEQESDVHRERVLVLPVNYFAGLWHCLNTGRMFGVYKQQWKKKDKYLDRITKKVAESLDAYHKVKEHESNEKKAEKNPDSYFKQVSNFKALKLIEESKKASEEIKDGK